MGRSSKRRSGKQPQCDGMASVATWQQPPHGLFDIIVPLLTARQFVVVQLVCKDWRRAARSCLKEAAPKRPDVDLQRLVNLHPNLTQLDLSHVEGLSAQRLAPLERLTALRNLCLSNISLNKQQEVANVGSGGRAGAAAGTGAPGWEEHAVSPNPSRRLTRACARAQQRRQPHARRNGRRAASDSSCDGTCSEGEHQQEPQEQRCGARPALVPAANTTPRAGCGRLTAAAAAAGPSGAGQRQAAAQQQQQEHSGASESCECSPEPGPGGRGHDSPAGPSRRAHCAGVASPHSPIDSLTLVLGRLTRLQADLCPALTAEMLASLEHLTDLTVDTLVVPELLAPLTRLQSLSIKRLANPERLDRLVHLTSLLINSDSSCAADFLPPCSRLPALQSLTFRTSSLRLAKAPAEPINWHAFSGLASLDLRSPVEVLRPGLLAIATLQGLTSLALDFYCATDEELMVTVVAPPNLQHLYVTSDRSRSGGVIDIHPNAGALRSARIRLYWTALNLVTEPDAAYPALTSLALDACFFLLYDGLVSALRQFPNLASLTLDNCLGLMDCEVAQLCELPGLVEVSLSGCHLLTDAGLRALSGLPQLATLKIKGLRKLSVHAAQAYMRQKPITRRYEDITGSFLSALSPLRDLRCVVLKHLHTASESQLLGGLAALTSLTRLEVKDVQAMSDAVLMGLSRHTQLRELSVLHCENVTPLGRGAIVRGLGQGLALDLEGCANIPDVTRPCALPTASTQAQLLGDDQVSSSNKPRRSTQHSNQH